MNIQPFKIHVSDEVLDDLKHRLDRTRWPDEIADSGWDYGSNLAYIKELVDYWRTDYDWRAQEEYLNSFSQYRATIDGIGVHYIYERGKGPNPLPVVITHGWPKSVFEMSKIIPLLTDPASHGGDPADSFDVVAPAGPGFGFSDRATNPGMTYWKIADLWHQLMTDGLGYQRYVAQGGDWGASVTARLGFDHPEHVLGIHTTLVGGARPYMGPGFPELTEKEKAYQEERDDWQEHEGGYNHIQGTKPQTLSYGLNDSPAGVCAWIVEKWRSWSDCNGDVETRFTKDELLNNVMVYWVTQTIGSSCRLYYESRRSVWTLEPGQKIQVPCGVAIFPKELFHPPREFAERSQNVTHFTEMPRGGHLHAMEEPELLVEDMRTFFRTLR